MIKITWYWKKQTKPDQGSVEQNISGIKDAEIISSTLNYLVFGKGAKHLQSLPIASLINGTGKTGFPHARDYT